MLSTLSDKIQHLIANQGNQVKTADVQLMINQAIDIQKKTNATAFALLDSTNFTNSALKTTIEGMINQAKPTSANFSSISGKAIITDLPDGSIDIDISIPTLTIDNKPNASVELSIDDLDPTQRKLSATLSQAILDAINKSTKDNSNQAIEIGDIRELVDKVLLATKPDAIYSGVSAKITQVGTSQIYRGAEHTYTKDYADGENIFITLDTGELVAVPITLSQDISNEHFKLDIPETDQHVHVAVFKKAVFPATTPAT